MLLFGRKTKKKYLISKKSVIGEGGEGIIFKIINHTSLCAKLYKKPTSERADKVLFMIENPPFNYLSAKNEKEALIWPVDALYSDEKFTRFIGFIMPLAIESADLTHLIFENIRPNSLSKFPWLKKFDIRHPESLKRIVVVAMNLANAIRLLHKTNKYVLVDCKPENVRINPKGFIQLLDLDSIQIFDKSNDIVYHGNSFTQEYRPPESFKKKYFKAVNIKKKESWDIYVFAAIAYKLIVKLPHTAGTLKQNALMRVRFGNLENGEAGYLVKKKLFPLKQKKKFFSFIPPMHNNFLLLNGGVQELFVRSFFNQKRPGIDEWIKELHSFYKELGNKRQKNQYKQLQNQRIKNQQLQSSKPTIKKKKSKTGRPFFFANIKSSNKKRLKPKSKRPLFMRGWLVITVVFSFLYYFLLQWATLFDYILIAENTQPWHIMYAPILFYCVGMIIYLLLAQYQFNPEIIIAFVFILSAPAFFFLFNWVWELLVYGLPYILILGLLEDVDSDVFEFIGFSLVIYFLLRLVLFIIDVFSANPRLSGGLDLLYVFLFLFIINQKINSDIRKKG